MLCLSGFELYSRWVPLLIETCILIFNGKNDVRTRRETAKILQNHNKNLLYICTRRTMKYLDISSLFVKTICQGLGQRLYSLDNQTTSRLF